MSSDNAQRRLGRGLDALLGDWHAPSIPPDQNRTNTEPPKPPGSSLEEIPIAAIRPNSLQPRSTFSPEDLKQLQDSIQTTGLLQPITVRRSATGGYELVAGERRLRAATALEWHSIPAIVRDYDDRTMLTAALVENLQREDLNPIEEGQGYARLTTEFGLTQTEIADLVGKDRSTIANFLRILQLPPEVRKLLETGALTLGHARPLLALTDHATVTQLATEAVQRGLSVRAVEERARQGANQDVSTPAKRLRGRPRKTDSRSLQIRHTEDTLRARFQTDVSILMKKDDAGEIVLRFYSADDFNRLLELIGGLG